MKGCEDSTERISLSKENPPLIAINPLGQSAVSAVEVPGSASPLA